MQDHQSFGEVQDHWEDHNGHAILIGSSSSLVYLQECAAPADQKTITAHSFWIIHHSSFIFLVRGAITDFGGQYREDSGLFFEEEIIIYRGRILAVFGFHLLAGKERNREWKIDLERGEVFI